MGLLDQLKGKLAETLGGEANLNNLLEHAMGIINNPSTGGLPGTIEAFKNKGLGDLAASWISTGKNLPVSAEQILQVLGPEKIGQIAQKAGMSGEALSQQLAVYLPQIIDKLTPNGEMPNASVLEDGISILKKAFTK